MSARYAKSYVCGGIDFPDDADDLNKKNIFQRLRDSKLHADVRIKPLGMRVARFNQ